MKFLRPEARNPLKSVESQSLYLAYIETVRFPESVEAYLRDPSTWEHNSNNCPHDFYLQKCVISDPLPGQDVDENNPRIVVEIIIFCPRRRVTMTFLYEGVRHADMVTSSGKWHGKLRQVIADEVILEGDDVVHEWCLEYGRFIRIKCQSFTRTTSV